MDAWNESVKSYASVGANGLQRIVCTCEVVIICIGASIRVTVSVCTSICCCEYGLKMKAVSATVTL